MIPVLVTSDINIINDKVVTELNDKTVLEVGKAIKALTNPMITEFVNTQEKLDELSNAINEANSANSEAIQKSTETVSTKINGLSSSLANSIELIERSFIMSPNKKIQPAAKVNE